MSEPPKIRPIRRGEQIAPSLNRVIREMNDLAAWMNRQRGFVGCMNCGQETLNCSCEPVGQGEVN